MQTAISAWFATAVHNTTSTHNTTTAHNTTSACHSTLAWTTTSTLIATCPNCSQRGSSILKVKLSHPDICIHMGLIPLPNGSLLMDM
jgi:hypothetical protein